jgi:flagellar motility protein MotE (MotC chaperone)
MKLRVLPLVITGASLLLVLKATGLMLTGHYAFEAQKEAPRIAAAQTYRPSAAARGGSSGDYDPMVTGSLPPKKTAEPAPAPAQPPAEASPGAAAPAAAGEPPVAPGLGAPPAADAGDLQNKNPQDLSSSERALLERLQSRREQLDGRAQELDLRESLLRAAEKKIEDELAELKTTEDQIAAADQARKAEEDQKLKDLVTMYENMKPKQAAAIFDALDMKVLVAVATRMNPKKTGDIVAKMAPDAAQRLTVALAKRELTDPGQTTAADALPKIEGKMPN